jgi:hypothetical protein
LWLHELKIQVGGISNLDRLGVFEQRLLQVLGRWPEHAEDEETLWILLLVANEQDTVPIGRPQLIDELAHELTPISPMTDMTPQSDGFPVDDGLLVTVAVRSETSVTIPEPPRDYLEVRFRGVGVVKEAGLGGDSGGALLPPADLFSAPLVDEELGPLSGPHDGERRGIRPGA